MKKHLSDYMLLLLLAVIWSTSFFLIKIAIRTIGPITLTSMRLCIAAAILCSFLLIKREWIPINKQTVILYLVVGLTGYTLPSILISVGEANVDSFMAAILMSIMPITTFILAHFFLSGERITLRKIIGLSFSLIGLMVMLGFSPLQTLGQHIFGEISILCGALSYAFTNIYIKMKSNIQSHKMAVGVISSAALTSIPMALVFEHPITMRPSMQSVLAVLALAIFATAIASVLYFKVLQALGATICSQISYVIPILGSIWGVLILRESINWKTLFALTLVLSGTYFCQNREPTN